MDFTKVKKNLERGGFSVKVFETGAEASAYLNEELDGVSIGIGGSHTVDDLGLYDSLIEHNEVFWHWRQPKDEARAAAKDTEVYLCSANGLAETGEIINIDGMGNRVSSTLWGHGKCIFIIGKNKLAPDFDSALSRARNIACSRRAADFPVKPACVVAGTAGVKCFDCKSPERVCKALVVLWEAPHGMDYEVILVNEDLGY